MTFLLGLGAKVLAWPSWVKVGLVAAVAIGALQAERWLTVRGLTRDIAKLESTLSTERLVHANTLVALQAERANVSTLTARLREQNRAIELLQARATQAEAVASQRALEVLRVREAAAEAIRSGQTPIASGADGVNRWLCERFQSCAP